jgi:hypothetical protein
MFLLRVWAEQRSDGELVWCGRVQQIISGETHSFDTWPMLVEMLLSMLFTTEATRDGRVLPREDETSS